jgi:hypothetical protein
VVSPVHIGLEQPDLLANIGGAAQAKACTDPALIADAWEKQPKPVLPMRKR